MPGLTINNSTHIAVLDVKILANLCSGFFTVDVTPSTWIASGNNNVLGASIKITNPYGVVIKYPTTSGYDIYPPMTSSVDVSIPTQANNYQYGNYIFDVYLTDLNGTIYTVSKSVNICAPNQKNKNVNYGSLSATLDGNCVTGRVAIMADTVPTYKGSISDSQVNLFTLKYPTVSQKVLETTSIGNFSAQLFEGEYRFEGTICAHYSLGDNVFANVNYKVKRYKTIRCLLDKSCVASRLAELQYQISQDCTDAEKIATQNTIINALLLLTVIDGLTNDGQDASDFIAQLEDILGCVCTCNCADGTPIIPLNTTADFVVQGCNVSFVKAGLTTTYTINNFAYVTNINDNGNAFTITTPTLSDCTKTQTITFNINVVYQQIKAIANSGSENSFWADIVNIGVAGLDGTCLGLTSNQINALTLKEKLQAIINEACSGSDCNSVITVPIIANFGSDVSIAWNNVSNVFSVDIYLDNILKGSVIQPVHQFKILGAADGNRHDYTLISRCSNGGTGATLTGSFTYFGCPTIAPITVSSTNVADAACPYNLASLVTSIPSGSTAEYHNLANTNTSSLVSNPSQVSNGSYYIYAKDANGCYSLPVNVVIVCSAVTACSAPQNLIVELINSGFRVRFQSAAYPPPFNSYTVKRRLKSDPDVSGSYTTIGSPSYNSTAGRWEILDSLASFNTLYTYRAISNCSSSAPYSDYDFAYLICPILSTTLAKTSIGYSFTHPGGGVNKYEVSIYTNDGSSLIHTNTHTAAFSNPVTGTFIYLTSGTTYKIRVRVFIDTYYMDCSFTSASTTQADTISIPAYMNLSAPSMSGTIVVSTIGGRTLRFANFSTCGVANAQVVISGGIGTINNNITSGVASSSQNVDILLPVGSYTFTGTLTTGCTSAASIYFI